MANLIQVDLVDSEKQIFSGSVEYLIAPGENGELGIYPYHIQMIVKLKPGLIRMQMQNQDSQLIFAISGGFLEVQSNHITILADIVERTDDLDEARLIKEKEVAIKRLKTSTSLMTRDVAKAQIALDIAIAQIKALEYIKKQSKS